MKHLVTLVILLYNISQAVAQNCSQSLEDATRAYYNGQFREVEPALSNCLENELEKAEKIEALKLLTNTQLLLNNSEKADEYLLQLLTVDPNYQLRESDLIEFKNFLGSNFFQIF